MSSEIKAEDICSDYCQSDEIISFRALTETKIDFGAGSVSFVELHPDSIRGTRLEVARFRFRVRVQVARGHRGGGVGFLVSPGN